MVLEVVSFCVSVGEVDDDLLGGILAEFLLATVVVPHSLDSPLTR